MPFKAPSLPYISGLDGLRALAVIAVLVYHADATWLPGGYLGVELFFVISGFLITSGMLSEWREHGAIDTKRFWIRRARRLLPAVAVLLVGVLGYSALFLPGELAGLRADAVASVAYVTNWHLIFNNESYFESVGRPSLLKHLWSLAVEEQFYIIWPLVLSVALRWLKPRGALAFVLLLAGSSIALMALLSQQGADTSRLYYGTDTRASGLLIGAALAFVWKPWALSTGTPRTRYGLDILGMVAALTLAYLFLHLDEFDSRLYTGGLALVALLSAVAIAVASHPGTLASKLLGLRALRWIGVRSYSLYIWHWPVFALTRPELDVQVEGLSLVALRFGLTLLLACLSYELVEKPVRAGALGRMWNALDRIDARPAWQRTITISGSSAVLALFIGLGVVTATANKPALPGYLVADPIRGVVLPDAPVEGGGETSAQTQPAETPTLEAPTPEPPTPTLVPPAPTAVPTAKPPEGVASTLDPPPGSGIEPAPPPIKPIEPAPPPTGPTSPPASLATETPPVNPPPPPPPIDVPAHTGPPVDVRLTAFGDSVLLGAANQLARTIGAIDVDATVSRQVGSLIPILRERAADGSLSDTVLIHIGNNGVVTARDFDTMMSLLEGHRVLIVNMHVPRSWEASNNAVIAEGAQAWGAIVVDWHAVAEGHPELFASDGIHLRPEGAAVYADLIASYLQ